jgi:hypothetical protein
LAVQVVDVASAGLFEVYRLEAIHPHRPAEAPAVAAVVVGPVVDPAAGALAVVDPAAGALAVADLAAGALEMEARDSEHCHPGHRWEPE